MRGKVEILDWRHAIFLRSQQQRWGPRFRICNGHKQWHKVYLRWPNTIWQIQEAGKVISTADNSRQAEKLKQWYIDGIKMVHHRTVRMFLGCFDVEVWNGNNLNLAFLVVNKLFMFTKCWHRADRTNHLKRASNEIKPLQIEAGHEKNSV